MRGVSKRPNIRPADASLSVRCQRPDGYASVQRTHSGRFGNHSIPALGVEFGRFGRFEGGG